MIAGARYGHTNLIAQDWRALASFYEQQFGCTPVPPERDFKGPDLERGTGIPGAHLAKGPAIIRFTSHRRAKRCSRRAAGRWERWSH